jgi:N-acetylmuramoyl-L-alanine amidase CwlA
MKKYKSYTKLNCSTRKSLGGSSNSAKAIKGIVIHWVGAVSSAKNNCDYFARNYVGASAHCFIDDDTIGYSVRASQAAWAVGKKYSTIYCRQFPKSSGRCWGKLNNSNTYSIEMCCSMVKGKMTVSDKTLENTITETARLCKKWGLTADDVVMHYNIAGKDCPGVFMSATKDPDKIFSEKFLTPLKKQLGTTAKKVTTTTSKTATTSTTVATNKIVKGGKYTLAKDVKGYYTSALTGTAYTVKKGTYYIYNFTSKALNVTKTKGVPGTWVKR